MLKYTPTFCTFDRSWKRCLLRYQERGSSYGDFVFMAAIPGLPEVKREEVSGGCQVWLRDPRGGYAQLMLSPSEMIENITFYEGLDAFAWEEESTPIVSESFRSMVTERLATGRAVEQALLELPACRWWGDEPIEGGLEGETHRWYYAIEPPAWLFVNTDRQGKTLSYRFLSPKEGVQNLNDRLQKRQGNIPE
jgi:hypothetical protein